MPTEEEGVIEAKAAQVVLRFEEELWIKRNLDIIDELCHPDYVGTIAGVPETVQGREALKQQIATYHAAFEFRFLGGRPKLLIVMSETGGVHVVIYRFHRLRHTGEFQGIPPTGKEVIFSRVDIYGVLDIGLQIIQQVAEFDLRNLRQQLRGAIPTPG